MKKHKLLIIWLVSWMVISIFFPFIDEYLQMINYSNEVPVTFFWIIFSIGFAFFLYWKFLFKEFNNKEAVKFVIYFFIFFVLLSLAVFIYFLLHLLISENPL